MTLILYSTSACGRCDKLKSFLVKNDIAVDKRDVDINPNFKVAALMHSISAVPALVRDDGKVLTLKHIMTGEILNEKSILDFVK